MHKDHFDWLLRARAESQQLLLRLLRLGTDRATMLEQDQGHAFIFALLVGAAFSLWRAAFLSDVGRHWPEITADANKLLAKLIVDNTINYPQDRDTKQWMGGYYLNNTRFRLMRAADRLRSDSAAEAALQEVEKLDEAGISAREPKEEWDLLRGALSQLISAFQRRIDLPTREGPHGT